MKENILNKGFAIVDNVFTDEEINDLLLTISQADTSKPTFCKTNDLFAIRQFLKEVPASVDKVFTDKLNNFISKLFGDEYFVVKSIYFDKPENSNWFVSYHQDLTISVDKKIDLEDFGPWTTKQNQFAVQPPLDILQDNFTIRIHLDNTNEENGALKVIPKSHLLLNLLAKYLSETILYFEMSTCPNKEFKNIKDRVNINALTLIMVYFGFVQRQGFVQVWH